MKFDQIVDKKGYLENLYVDLLITIVYKHYHIKQNKNAEVLAAVHTVAIISDGNLLPWWCRTFN